MHMPYVTISEVDACILTPLINREIDTTRRVLSNFDGSEGDRFIMYKHLELLEELAAMFPKRGSIH